MAIGIFINSAIHSFPTVDQGFGKDLTLFLLLVWVFITASFLRSYSQGVFIHAIWSIRFKVSPSGLERNHLGLGPALVRDSGNN